MNKTLILAVFALAVVSCGSNPKESKHNEFVPFFELDQEIVKLSNTYFNQSIQGNETYNIIQIESVNTDSAVIYFHVFDQLELVSNEFVVCDTGRADFGKYYICLGRRAPFKNTEDLFHEINQSPRLSESCSWRVVFFEDSKIRIDSCETWKSSFSLPENNRRIEIKTGV